MLTAVNPRLIRIVFMGTPHFAVESLRILVENNYNVVGVVTMPDKPVGRGYNIQFSPVKQYALSKGLHILQPEKLGDEAFLMELQKLLPDMQVVVAFRLLPEVVWSMPQYGTFNLHASLLPQYRGAAPINWAIINGEKQTGVTTFMLTNGIDEGNIIQQKKISISQTDTAGELHDKLMLVGAKLVKSTVNLLATQKITAIEQSMPNSPLHKAPKIFKEHCAIQCDWEVERVHNFVRGLSPYPSAHINIRFPNQPVETFLKVYETNKELCVHDIPLGTLVTDGKKYAKIALPNGFIHLLSAQMAGKKRMTISELLRGLRV